MRGSAARRNSRLPNTTWAPAAWPGSFRPTSDAPSAYRRCLPRWLAQPCRIQSSTGPTRRISGPPSIRRSKISRESTIRPPTTSASGRPCDCSRRIANHQPNTRASPRDFRTGSATRFCRAGNGASWTLRPSRARNVEERFVLLPPIATAFGLQARISDMSAERSTVGSALFVAHQLNRLQGERYTGFEISRMLAHGDDAEEDEALPLHGMGWAFDVPSSSLSKTDLRDLKFILTDLRQAGLLAYVEDDDNSALSRRPAPRSRRGVRAVLLGRHGRARAAGWIARGAAHFGTLTGSVGPRHPDRNICSGRHGGRCRGHARRAAARPIQPFRRSCCLLVVLATATAASLRVAVFVSAMAMLALNYFLLPPLSHAHDCRSAELGGVVRLPGGCDRREPAFRRITAAKC